jgi:single-stranded-DNA-specific exonuclease
MKLIVRDVPPRSSWALEQAGVHPLLARLYASRGVQSLDELDDGLAKLLPPSSMKGCLEAAKLLADAIALDISAFASWPITIAMAQPPAPLACAVCGFWAQSM